METPKFVWTIIIIIIIGIIFQIPSHNETVYKGKMVLLNVFGKIYIIESTQF
jgi:hypothetical protein